MGQGACMDAYDDIEPTPETMAELKAIMEEYDDPDLDREYSAHPQEVLRFVETCRRLGRARADHSPEESHLLTASNRLEERFGLPRQVSHEIRRHCAA